MNFLRHLLARRTVTLDPPGRVRGDVLLSYLTGPFLGGPEEARGHTNWQECRAMAEVWREAGFRVTAMDRKDRRTEPARDVFAVIDLGVNLSRWASQLEPRCRKVLHVTGAHWLTQNTAELLRLDALKKRRGVSLVPRRQSLPSRGIESADVATYLGNAFTAASFAFAGKPMVRIPISSACMFDWPQGRDWELARRRFLWMGSYGMVHKGLDLALEAFARRPDLHLTVCGRPEKEADFYECYRRELESLPNVTLAGWVPVESEEFERLRESHGAVLSPSCSEGGGGATIHAMHAGMAPIVTPEASVDVGDFGIAIAEPTPAGVCNAIDFFAALPPSEAAARARAAWEHVRAHHTLGTFRRAYADFVRGLVE